MQIYNIVKCNLVLNIMGKVKTHQTKQKSNTVVVISETVNKCSNTLFKTEYGTMPLNTKQAEGVYLTETF